MLRLLGLVFLLVICVGIAPLGLVVGATVCAGWLLSRRHPSGGTHGRSSTYDDRVLDLHSELAAIPLVNAVYCVNCDSITNSPHDACGVCGSHSVISVSRMWQLSVTQEQPKAARYKISFTADVRDIPANGLSESTKLIGRLAELGGHVQGLHIQVELADSSSALINSTSGRGAVRRQRNCRGGAATGSHVALAA